MGGGPAHHVFRIRAGAGPAVCPCGSGIALQGRSGHGRQIYAGAGLCPLCRKAQGGKQGVVERPGIRQAQSRPQLAQRTIGPRTRLAVHRPRINAQPVHDPLGKGNPSPSVLRQAVDGAVLPLSRLFLPRQTELQGKTGRLARRKTDILRHAGDFAPTQTAALPALTGSADRQRGGCARLVHDDNGAGIGDFSAIAHVDTEATPVLAAPAVEAARPGCLLFNLQRGEHRKRCRFGGRRGRLRLVIPRIGLRRQAQVDHLPNLRLRAVQRTIGLGHLGKDCRHVGAIGDHHHVIGERVRDIPRRRIGHVVTQQCGQLLRHCARANRDADDAAALGPDVVDRGAGKRPRPVRHPVGDEQHQRFFRCCRDHLPGQAKGPVPAGAARGRQAGHGIGDAAGRQRVWQRHSKMGQLVEQDQPAVRAIAGKGVLRHLHAGTHLRDAVIVAH